MLEPPWIAAREAAAKRTSFFAHLATITAYAIFPSWPVFLEALATFIIPPELPSDQLAARLARDGDPEPFHIEENETTFTIDWKGSYRIEGAAFVYMDRETGRVAAIHGYPTHKLIQMR